MTGNSTAASVMEAAVFVYSTIWNLSNSLLTTRTKICLQDFFYIFFIWFITFVYLIAKPCIIISYCLDERSEYLFNSAVFCSYRQAYLWNVLCIIKHRICGKISPIKQISYSFTTTANQIMIVFKINPHGNRNTIVVFNPSNKRTKFLFNFLRNSLVKADTKFRLDIFSNL